jgi:hypothetical protein
MSTLLVPGGAGMSLAQWIDAYSATLECIADAKNNQSLLKTLKEQVKQLKSDVAELPTEQNRSLLSNQQIINQAMEFSNVAHKAMLGLWKEVKKDIAAASWNLADDVHYAEETKGGYLRFWQGDGERRDLGFVVDRQKALLAIRFLKFVVQQSQDTNPINHTKKMLLAQGINEHNFHKHADKIAFPNPWTTPA